MYFINRILNHTLWLIISSIIISLPTYGNTGSVIDFVDLVNTHGSEQKAIDYLLKQEMVILKFYATWCPPCRQLSPCFASIARQYSHVLCVEINTEKYPQTSAQFSIRSLPSLIFLHKGANIGFRSGFRGQRALEDDINTIFNKRT